MNAPKLNHDDLIHHERSLFYAWTAIGAAIQHGLIMGANIKKDERGPCVVLFLPPMTEANPEGGDPTAIQRLVLSTPTHGADFLQVMQSAGRYCHDRLGSALSSGNAETQGYFEAIAYCEKLHRNGASKIITGFRPRPN